MPEFRNSKLYDSTVALARAALDIVRKALEAGIEVPTTQESRWTEQPNLLVRQVHEKPLWVIVVHRVEKQIQSTAEYKRWVKLLAEDPTIGKQINTLVGTANQRVRLDTDQLLWRLVSEIMEEAKGPKLDIAIVTRMYDFLERAFYSEDVILEELAPLIGFEAATPEIKLGDGLSIIRLTPEEIASCLSMGVIRVGPWEDVVHNPPKYAIKVTWKEPKVFGEDEVDKGKLEQTMKRIADAPARVYQVLQALRLYKTGQCYIAGMIRRPADWFVSYSTGGSTLQLPGLLWFAKYVLEESDVDKFTRFWNGLNSAGVKSRGFLEVAISRFSLAQDRHAPEDQVIDLIISSEALFLCDIPDDQYRGELRYRLAMRAGLFSADSPREQRDIFRLIRDAYDARSAIVHGGKPSLPSGFTSLKDFVNKVAECIRMALLKAVALASTDGTPKYLVDWDELVFRIDKS